MELSLQLMLNTDPETASDVMITPTPACRGQRSLCPAAAVWNTRQGGFLIRVVVRLF